MKRSWFDDAGLGMFIHWDHASQEGLEISWPMMGGVFSLPRCQDVTPEAYHALADTFDPAAWDPVDLARRARAAGMRYVVFTTRHHSGYAMFHTAYSDHGVRHSPYGADVVAETVEAFRSVGLRIGLYYSLSDWHHPDYPAVTEADRPYLGSPPMPSDDQAERFRAYLLGQMGELLENYGCIDLLWFDGQWERAPQWFGVDDIAALARTANPEILINDRLPGHGDFVTPEQFVPAAAPGERWESCVTMNDSWGWNRSDTNYKSPLAIISALCETVGRGGNLLLNVSPTGDGSLPPEQIERLDVLAAWMEAHHEAIHDTDPGLEPWQFYGPSTRRGQRVFLFALMRPQGMVTVRGIPVRRVVAARSLATGDELGFSTRTGVLEQLTEDPDGEVTIHIADDQLDPLVTVLELELADEPIAGRPAIHEHEVHPA